MPIKPENRSRYPANWREIVEQVRERSGDRCEGSPAYPDCRVANHAVGYRVDGRWVQLGESIDAAGLAIDSAVEDGFKVTRIVLTCAHLDHTPEHCALENLRHWCQRCHLHYDREHHAQTAYATRKAAARTLDLFDTHVAGHRGRAAAADADTRDARPGTHPLQQPMTETST